MKKSSNRYLMSHDASLLQVAKLSGLIAFVLLSDQVTAQEFQPVPSQVFDNEALLEKGFLSVTMSIPDDDGVMQPGAVPDDGIDDTAAIQRAINEAVRIDLLNLNFRNDEAERFAGESERQGTAVFFPPGVYQISNTLEGVMRVRFDPNVGPGRYEQQRRRPTVLIGSTAGSARPVIKLVPTDASFDDSSNPKEMLWVWAERRDPTGAGPNNTNLNDDNEDEEDDTGGPLDTRGSDNPEDEQANISFSQVIRGIDFDLGGRAGAIGVRHAGSQGSTFSDSRIDATDAFAGIFNPPGQGGGVYNVNIVGGQYGVMIDKIARYPVMAGMVFEGQTEAAVFLDRIQATFTMSGFSIQSEQNAAAVAISSGGSSHAGSVSLIDGRIELPSESTAITNTNKNIYLRNVHFGGGVSRLVRSNNRDLDINNPDQWTRVGEYAYTGSGGESLINGVIEGGNNSVSEFENDIQTVTTVPTIETLVLTHVWDRVPSFEDADTVDATRVVGRNIVADGETDVTADLQAVLDANEKVFLPRGEYLVNDTLLLGSDTKLFGVGKTFTSLNVGDDWLAGTGEPVIRTVDDASGETFLANLFIFNEAQNAGVSYIDWRAGANSIFKDIFFAMDFVAAQNSTLPDIGSVNDVGAIRIRGSGGGRFYAVSAEFTPMQVFTFNEEYRMLVVEGTTEPLKIYGLNVERNQSAVQSEIRNASDVEIYSLKGETFIYNNGAEMEPRFIRGEGMGPDILSITNSADISVYGFSGNASPENQHINLHENVGTITIANIAGVNASEDHDSIRETFGNEVHLIPGNRSASLVKRVVETVFLPVVQTLSVADLSVVETDVTQIINVTVSVPNNVQGEPIVFAYDTRIGGSGTAEAGVDFGVVTAEGRIEVGASSTTLPVEIFGDTEVEENEFFFLRLLGEVISGPGEFTPFSQGRITINDDDSVLGESLLVSVNDGFVGETSGTRVVSFFLNGNQVAPEDIVVNYRTVNGTATKGEDYSEPVPGQVLQTVTILKGRTSANVEIPISDDFLLEGNENFSVEILNVAPTSLVEIGNQRGTVTIVDDENRAEPVLSLKPIWVGEQNATVQVSVSADRNVAADIVINYSTVGGTATAAKGDFKFAEGMVTLRKGEKEVLIPLEILDDAEVENIEIFQLRVESLGGAGASVEGSRNTIITIIDNEVAPAGSGVIEVGGLNGTESRWLSIIPNNI